MMESIDYSQDIQFIIEQLESINRLESQLLATVLFAIGVVSAVFVLFLLYKFIRTFF